MDWAAIAICIGSSLGTAGVAWGAMSVRIRVVERDVAACVRRELYDSQSTGQNQKLDRIERQVERILDKISRDDTSPHRIRREHNDE